MKNISYALLSAALLSCSPIKEYKLFRRDKGSHYPTEKLVLGLTSDSTGFFINSDKTRETFRQELVFVKDDKYMIIKDAIQESSDFISLKKGDTLIVYKNQFHGLYKGKKRYILSFKKKGWF